MLSRSRRLSESGFGITTMDAPGRLLHRHSRHIKLSVRPPSPFDSAYTVPFRNLPSRSVLHPHNKINCYPYYSNNRHNNPLFRQFLSLSSLDANSLLHRFSVNSHSSSQDQNHGGSLPPLDWYGPGGSFGYRDGDRDVSVVVLGWLGAQEKHLRRYLEWYNSRGYRALGFVVGIDEVLWRLDFARNVEDRFEEFLEDLVQWVMQGKAIGKERSLVFHCFSNTGWLVYGAAVEKLQEKEGVYDRIKGCIVDSGGGELMNLKVWAAGFAAAMLKRPISPANNSVDVKGIHNSKNGYAVCNIAGQSCGDRIVETVILATLEKLFFVLLNLPYAQRRLRRLETILYNSPPPCPQLYLYSSADTVIPRQMIEALMEQQRSLGRKVFARDFKTTPHVDHYRTFPHIYLSELNSFLKECFDTMTTSGGEEAPSPKTTLSV